MLKWSKVHMKYLIPGISEKEKNINKLRNLLSQCIECLVSMAYQVTIVFLTGPKPQCEKIKEMGMKCALFFYGDNFECYRFWKFRDYGLVNTLSHDIKAHPRLLKILFVS